MAKAQVKQPQKQQVKQQPDQQPAHLVERRTFGEAVADAVSVGALLQMWTLKAVDGNSGALSMAKAMRAALVVAIDEAAEIARYILAESQAPATRPGPSVTSPDISGARRDSQ